MEVSRPQPLGGSLVALLQHGQAQRDGSRYLLGRHRLGPLNVSRGDGIRGAVDSVQPRSPSVLIGHSTLVSKIGSQKPGWSRGFFDVRGGHATKVLARSRHSSEKSPTARRDRGWLSEVSIVRRFDFRHTVFQTGNPSCGSAAYRQVDSSRGELSETDLTSPAGQRSRMTLSVGGPESQIRPVKSVLVVRIRRPSADQVIHVTPPR